MGIEVWVDQVSTGQEDIRVTTNPLSHRVLATLTYDPILLRLTSWLARPDDSEENTLNIPPELAHKQHRVSTVVDGSCEDVDVHSSPTKNRGHGVGDIEPPAAPAQSKDTTSEDVESHHSSRLISSQ